MSKCLKLMPSVGMLGALFAHGVLADTAADTSTIITPLMEKPLAARTAAVASMVTVEYAPGAGTPPHSHPADTFVYVLEGAIEMQVAGGELKVLKAGDTYYEQPSDKHMVSRNASKTDKARFLVMFVKDKDAPVLVPETAATHP